MGFLAKTGQSLLLAPLIVAVAVVQVAGQVTPWFETAGGSVRLVVAPPVPGDTQLLGIIDVDLEPGWKTYWREPGSSGIPPQLSVAGSKGLSEPSILYPTPIWIDNPYGDFAGYDAPVAVPFTVERTADGEAELRASLFMGFCEDVCIPVQASFALPITYASGSTLDAVRVAAAHAELPQATVKGINVTISANPPPGYALVEIQHGSGEKPQLFVHATDGTLFKPPRVQRSADRATSFAIEPAVPLPSERTVEAIVTVRTGQGNHEATYMLPIAGAAQ